MSRSKSLFDLAKQVLPGGVNSPVRAFHGVGGNPIFVKQGRQAYLIDVDGREYIDYVCSWGPLITGHAHPYIVEKVRDAVNAGLSFGAPTENEIKLAQAICHIMPAIKMIRFVNSGTEAAMSAIRLARGFTKKNKVIKFTGCYHGHADGMLVAAGSGGLTFGVPNSAGVPELTTQDTLVAEYNHIDQVKTIFETYPNDIAAVIVEPIAANMNCVPPSPGFLQTLRALCDDYKSLLILDEVITGFRVAKGGAQALYGITPDLTVLGKIIGGGMPVGAFGGRRDVMEALAPLGPVYQAGTLSGNPIAMAAGLAQLELIMTQDFYEKLSHHTMQLAEGLKGEAEEAGIKLRTTAVGGLFGFLFTDAHEISCEKHVQECDVALFKQFYHAMLQQGVYFAPSLFESGFVSSLHGNKEIEFTLQAARHVFKSLKRSV